MSTTSKITTIIDWTGDVDAQLVYASADNALSPADIDIVTLVLGANTITLPTGGSTPIGVTIVPPAGNVETLTLKGVTGDTGILLHSTNPTTIMFGTGVVSFVLTAGAAIVGLRLVWS